MPTKQIFAAQHSPSIIIRAIYGREVSDGSKGIDIVLSGVVKARFYNPRDVTKWFEGNSKKNVEAWRQAYHTSGLYDNDFKRPTSKDIVLPVPYYSQRDNERDPFGTCNVTCLAMNFAFYKLPRKFPQFGQREDEIEYFMEKNGRDRHLHADLAWTARQYGLAATFDTDRTFEEIRAELRAGHPVIVSGTFTKSGHIIDLIGTKGDDFLVNDPYGNALKGYRDRDGAGLVYPFEYLEGKMRGGKNAKWAHFMQPK